MIIVSYDISNNKLRTQFAKFLMQYGDRLQYSVYEIQNSERILNIVTEKIKFEFVPSFTGADSVIIFRCKQSQVLRFGNAAHKDCDLLVL